MMIFIRSRAGCCLHAPFFISRFVFLPVTPVSRLVDVTFTLPLCGLCMYEDV